MSETRGLGHTDVMAMGARDKRDAGQGEGRRAEIKPEGIAQDRAAELSQERPERLRDSSCRKRV